MEKVLAKETINSTETLKIIYERRAVRKYKDKPLEKNYIEQILDAGRMAPSAINKQPWKFYILTNKETIKLFSKEIAKVVSKVFLKIGLKGIIKSLSSLHWADGINFLKTKDPIFHEAPVVIFITSPKDNEWAALDIGMCSQNMMLAAKSLGLDSCPVGLAKFVEQTTVFSKLNIPTSEKVQLATIFGYGNETPELHERIKNNAFFINDI